MSIVYAIKVDHIDDGVNCEPPFYNKREDAVKELKQAVSEYIKMTEDDGGQVFVSTIDTANACCIDIRFAQNGDVIVSYQLVVCEVI